MAKALPGSFENLASKLFSEISRQNNGKNIFFSPTSIALALSMCTSGARTNTLQEMLGVLEAPTIEQLTQTGEQMMQLFANVAQDKEVKLKLANRLYAQKGYQLREDYLNLVQKSFQADMKLEDFVGASEQAVQTINAWVENQTNQLIRNLLSTDAVTPDTRLILINCIYFKGAWVHPFKEHHTNEKADFHELNGTVSKIKLMYQQEEFFYVNNKELNVQVAHLPYKSENYSTQLVFTVILPNQGVSFENIEQRLTANPQLMKQLLSQQGGRSRELQLYLPKFKMETTFQLNDVLQQLGVKDAFSSASADFTGMVKSEDMTENLYISSVSVFM